MSISAISPEAKEATCELHRRYAATRDPLLREQLVHLHLRFARSLANLHRRAGDDLEELSQVATIGLMHAIDRFDPDRGVQFTTFAWMTISGELKRWFRDTSWGVHVPRSLQERYLLVARAADRLSQSLRRMPTIGDIAHGTGLTEDEVIECIELRHSHRPSPLERPFSSEHQPIQLGREDEELMQVEKRSEVTQLLATLPPRERTIVRMRFWEQCSQSEIAQRLGMSQMHVSRLLARSLTRLREYAPVLEYV